MPNCLYRKKIRGVTLLEILAVISIIATISIFALPLLSRFTKNAKLRGASKQLSNMLHLSKALAVTNNAPSRIRIYSETGEVEDNVMIEFQESTNLGTWLPYGKIWHVPTALNIYATDFSSTAEIIIEFTSLGTASFTVGGTAATTLTLHLENRNEVINRGTSVPAADRVTTYSVVVDPTTGFLAIYSYGVNDPWSDSKM